MLESQFFVGDQKSCIENLTPTLKLRSFVSLRSEISVLRHCFLRKASFQEQRETRDFQRRGQLLWYKAPTDSRCRCTRKGASWHRSEPGPKSWYLRQIGGLLYLKNIITGLLFFSRVVTVFVKIFYSFVV